MVICQLFVFVKKMGKKERRGFGDFMGRVELFRWLCLSVRCGLCI